MGRILDDTDDLLYFTKVVLSYFLFCLGASNCGFAFFLDLSLARVSWC